MTPVSTTTIPTVSPAIKTRSSILPQITAFKNRMGIPTGTKISVKKPADILEYAVNKAYIDMQPRTIKGHEIIKTAKLRNDLADRFFKYFNDPAPSTESDFDKIHSDFCDFFLTGLNKIFASTPQAFGKAQKVINMAFKYLYCFDDAISYLPHFTYCHMPIDSYTLNWCFDNKLYKKSKIRNWSTLKKPDYDILCDKIRKKLAPQSPLIEEFVIWPEEKAKANEINFIKTIMDYIADNYDLFSSSGITSSGITSSGISSGPIKPYVEKTVKNKVKTINNDRRKDGKSPLINTTVLSMLSSISTSALIAGIAKCI
ncbi:MAG: hypothetical protein KH349_05660 [Clostridium sp.]|nr:hypothetical protein [Clostridium sp.]